MTVNSSGALHCLLWDCFSPGLYLYLQHSSAVTQLPYQQHCLGLSCMQQQRFLGCNRNRKKKPVTVFCSLLSLFFLGVEGVNFVVMCFIPPFLYTLFSATLVLPNFSFCFYSAPKTCDFDNFKAQFSSCFCPRCYMQAAGLLQCKVPCEKGCSVSYPSTVCETMITYQ